ncbi:uncharacterized protein ISCGN_020281 [Ixodes scapularis]
MYYVYVRFPSDNEKAIMPVSLVKDYDPKSNTDIPTELVQAYWRSEIGTEEGYYDARIILVAESKKALLEEMSQRKRMVIPRIFEGPLEASTSTTGPSAKALKQQRAAAKKRQLTSLVSKRKLETSSDDEDPGVVPKAMLKEAEETIRSLRLKLGRAREPSTCLACAQAKAELKLSQAMVRRLQEEVEDLRRTNSRLTNAVLDNIGIAREPVHQDRAPVVAVAGPVPPGPIRVPRRSAPSIVDAPATRLPLDNRPESPDLGEPSGSVSTRSLSPPPLEVVEVDMVPPAEVTPAEVPPADVTPAEVPPAEVTPAEATPARVTPAEATPARVTPAKVTPAKTPPEVPAELPAEPQGAAVAAPPGEAEAASWPPPLAVQDGEIHLGHGIKMRETVFNHALSKAATPGRFIRMVSRSLWEPAELFDRSVSGQACRRLLKEGAVGKKPLTPEKIDALAATWLPQDLEILVATSLDSIFFCGPARTMGEHDQLDHHDYYFDQIHQLVSQHDQLVSQLDHIGSMENQFDQLRPDWLPATPD